MTGSFETVDDRPVVRFERRLEHPVERVWRAITDPEELAHWFPARVTVDLRPGGRMRFTFADEGLPPTEGEITELDPPRRFAFWWGDELLAFELEPAGDGRACVLRLTHVLSRRDAAARDAAGWHVCLDRLERRLTGEDTGAPTSDPTAEWRAHYDAYAEQGLPTGAPVPGD
jgi:uncharacterized protein YndB with AHSA1/START domain